jgi:RNA polymerase sigma-70 factor, ECF subfamily
VTSKGYGTSRADLDRSRMTDAFDAAFELARPRLAGVARSLVGPDLAEDAVHDTYLLARERHRQLRDPLALGGWLHRILVNRCFELHRRRRRSRVDPAGVSAEPSEAPAPESSIDLRAAIDGLAPRDRTVLVLHYGHGYSFLEIAAMLEISHANVRAIASRGRRRLYRAYAGTTP